MLQPRELDGEAVFEVAHHAALHLAERDERTDRRQDMEITVGEQPGNITLGPVLFNWKPETWRDFYFRVADEAPVTAVYLGETVCSKRAVLFEPYYRAVAERLSAGGKDSSVLPFTTFVVVTRARLGGAMPTDLLGPPGRCSGCWPHDGEVDGGAVGRFSF
jgi:hypothetical protein